MWKKRHNQLHPSQVVEHFVKVNILLFPVVVRLGNQWGLPSLGKQT